MEENKETGQEEHEELVESSEYSSKSEFNKPKLVEITFQKCIEARSKEMKSGYYNLKIDKQGNVTAKIWIPDSRIVFDSHILTLKNLLSPEIEKDSSFKEKEKLIIEMKVKLFDKYCYEKQELKRIDGNLIWVKTGEKEIPEKDATLLALNIIMDRYYEAENVWNSKVFTYWNLITNLNDKTFSGLMKLVDKLNYFKSVVAY